MNKKLKKGLTTTMAAAMGLGVVIPAVPVIAAPATSAGLIQQQVGHTTRQEPKLQAHGFLTMENGITLMLMA